MVKNPPANAGDASTIPRWGRSPGGGCGNPLQHSCLQNPMARGAWGATARPDLVTKQHQKGPSASPLYWVTSRGASLPSLDRQTSPPGSQTSRQLTKFSEGTERSSLYPCLRASLRGPVPPLYFPETPSLPTPSLEKGVVRWEIGSGIWEILVSLPPAF